MSICGAGDDGNSGDASGGGGDRDGEGGGDGGNENKVPIKGPSLVTRCEAPLSRSCHGVGLARAGKDLNPEYAVRGSLAAR